MELTIEQKKKYLKIKKTVKKKMDLMANYLRRK